MQLNEDFIIYDIIYQFYIIYHIGNLEGIGEGIGPRDTACTRLVCCNVIHKLYQPSLPPERVARFRFFLFLIKVEAVESNPCPTCG